MLTQSLPHSLTSLLAAFAPCFHLLTFQTFQALVAGFLTHPGPRTITGMLTGAGLARRRHHDLAYRFFSRVRWCPDQAGLIACDLITTWLLADHTPLLVAVDDTLWRRSGPRLHGAAWHHDGNGPAATGPPGTPLGGAGRDRWPAGLLPAGVPADPGPAVDPRRCRAHSARPRP